jgi:hypothetical protein
MKWHLMVRSLNRNCVTDCCHTCHTGRIDVEVVLCLTPISSFEQQEPSSLAACVSKYPSRDSFKQYGEIA